MFNFDASDSEHDYMRICVIVTMFYLGCEQDYTEISVAYRPSHADATYDFKYGVRAIQVKTIDKSTLSVPYGVLIFMHV